MPKWKRSFKNWIADYSHCCPHCPINEQEDVVLVVDLERFIETYCKDKPYE